MKRSTTPWRLPRSVPELRVAGAVAVALLLCTGLGCVTQGKHQRIVGELRSERDDLKEKVQQLQRSNRALGEERVRLIDQMEDLRQEKETLSTDVAKLQRTRDLLETHLKKREEEVEKLSKLSGSYESLVKDLESEVASGQIQIEQLREGLRLNLSQDILFRSGAVTLEPYGVRVLDKVAKQLRGMSQEVEVQGHTDNVPLSPALARRWGTNWELAAARAAQVVQLFQKDGIAPERLRAVSYGPYKPVADNATPEGRARNRRIEIRLIPVEAPEVPSRSTSPDAETAGGGDAEAAPGS